MKRKNIDLLQTLTARLAYFGILATIEREYRRSTRGQRSATDRARYLRKCFNRS